MSWQPQQRRPPRPVTLAAAGGAFAVGVVAALELATLALPGPRGTFRTWGPVVTVLAVPVIAVVGIPGALLVEAAGRRAARPAGATAAGYLALALTTGTAVWLLWRALVGPQTPLTALGREFVVVALGAMGMWAGARLAQRHGPGTLFAFAGAALAALTGVTALVMR